MIQEHGIQMVDFKMVDIHGQFRHVTIPAADFNEEIMAEGVGQRVIVHCPEAGFCLNKTGEFTVVPSLKLPKGYIKGTVGAGDAFCAGCLYGIYKGFDDKTILEFASGAACCNLSAVDSVSGMQSKEYIFDMIANHERVEL